MVPLDTITSPGAATPPAAPAQGTPFAPPPALAVDAAYGVLVAALQAEAVRDGGDFARASTYLQAVRSQRGRWNSGATSPTRTAPARQAGGE